MSFDRDISFAEVFETRESADFLQMVVDMIGSDFRLCGKRGKSIVFPANSSDAARVPEPTCEILPINTELYDGSNGTRAIGVPVFHEGDAFAMLAVCEKPGNQTDEYLKLMRLAASVIEWYVHFVHQRRMISELQVDTQQQNYKQLLEEHEKTLASEQKYKDLAENLEYRVAERKRELEKTQRQMLQQEKMASIGQLAGGVAHEINNPTGFVYSNLQTLTTYLTDLKDMLEAAREIHNDKDDPESEKFMEKWENFDLDYVLEDLPDLLNESLKGTERIIRIVKSLSRFSHVDHEKIEEINVNDILDSTVELFWNEITKKAKVVKNYGKLPRIKANVIQLSKVFVNLIMNAMYFTNKGGTITLMTRSVGDGVEIVIMDSGKGIEADNISKIFNPFYTTKPVGQGAGLGLSISYEIINAHKGSIRAESEPGHGAAFIINLPVEGINYVRENVGAS